MRLSRFLQIFSLMLLLACGALPHVECQTPSPAGKSEAARPQTAPGEDKCQKSYDPARCKLADDLEKNATVVDQIVDAGPSDEKKPEFKTALAQILQEAQALQKPGTTQPPIKVRGGAMTVRMTSRPDTAGDGSDCVVLPLDPTTHAVQIQFVEDITAQPWNPMSQTLSRNWKVDLYGRHPKGDKGENGIELVYTDSCIDSGQTKPGVSIKSIATTQKHFYVFRDAHNGQQDVDGKTWIKRFKDPTCSKHLPHPTNGDEDTCEQMSYITIDGAYFKPCTNGECLIQIVQQ